MRPCVNYRQLRILPLPSIVVKSSPPMEVSSGTSNLPEPLPSKTTTQFTIASLVAAAVFFILFTIYLRYFSDPSHASPSTSSRKGVDRSTVRSLPVYDYNGAAKYQVDCAICLSEFNENERVKLIPFCKHVFHPECIDTWLFSHVSCPVCRSARFFDGDLAGGGLGLAKEDSHHGVRNGGERSTAENNDTCINILSFGHGMRRISSWTSFAGRTSMSLHRTCSF